MIIFEYRLMINDRKGLLFVINVYFFLLLNQFKRIDMNHTCVFRNWRRLGISDFTVCKTMGQFEFSQIENFIIMS